MDEQSRRRTLTAVQVLVAAPGRRIGTEVVQRERVFGNCIRLF
jgi:hypothetical protein